MDVKKNISDSLSENSSESESSSESDNMFNIDKYWDPEESESSSDSESLSESEKIDTSNKLKEPMIIKKNNNHDDKLNDIYGMVKELLEQNKYLINKVIRLEEKISNISITKSIEHKNNLCEEDIILDEKFVLDVLIFRSSETIIRIIRKHYESNGKIDYPFRCLGKQKFEYYNNKWIEDTYANNIVETIFSNIKKLLKKVNIMGKVSMNNFIENQKFIYKLDNDKYKRKFVNNLRSELMKQ